MVYFHLTQRAKTKTTLFNRQRRIDIKYTPTNGELRPITSVKMLR